MFGTPLIAFSIGEATVCSSTSADAPGYTALTVTTGGAISGYWAIGRLRIADKPASTRNTEITAAKIGRSIKKRENMSGFLALFFRGLRRRFCGVGGRGRRSRTFLHRLFRRWLRRRATGGVGDRAGGRGGDRRGELDLPTGHQFGDAVDDHAIAGRQPRIDDP